MRSILFAKIEASTYKSDAMVKGLKEAGFDIVHEFDWQLLRFNIGVEGMRKEFLKTAEATKPDYTLLHIQNSETFDLDTILELSKISKVINYSFDIRDKERTEWAYQYAKHIHYSFFGCVEDVAECQKRGIFNAGVLQSSCDMDMYQPLNIPPLPSNSPIVFIGNDLSKSNLDFPQAQERVDMVYTLKQHYGEKFKVFGLHWPNTRAVKYHEETYIYNQCKIAIAQNNYDRELYFSDRIWRIMASGAFVLTKYVKGIETIFERGVHLDWWHDLDELIALIDKYFHDNKERIDIAKMGTKLVRENHSWKDRFSQMISVIE